MKYRNGNEYVGGWKAGKKDGIGKIKFAPDKPHGEYEGGWKNGLQEGRGVMKFKNGEEYDGEFKNGW